MGLSISLAAEPLFHLGSLTVTNSMVTTVGVSCFLVLVALIVRIKLTSVPGKLQTVLELTYSWFAGLTESITGRAEIAKDLFPFVMTLFFFILISNWLGMIPGISLFGIQHNDGIVPIFRSPTADLNTTLLFALLAVGYVQFLGLKYRGFKKYLGRFFSFKSPLDFYVGVNELVSEFVRIISFSFRLFGNIFAGEVLIATMLFLTILFLPFLPIIPLPFYALELFVGILQALIFSFLTIVFAGIATADHESAPKAAAAN